MSNNIIHPTSVIDPEAKIGKNNYIGPYCIIGPKVKIGDDNRLEAFVSIGTPAEHRDFFRLPPGQVNIGDYNVMREFVTVNGGIRAATTIESRCSLLKSSHVGHDAVLKNFCNLGCGAIVGGHSVLDEGVNLGLSSVVHQQRIVGAYAMVGMNATVTKHILPFSLSFGSPAEVKRLNRIGLQRANISSEELGVFEDWFESQNFNHEVHHKLNHGFDTYLNQFFKIKNQWSVK